MGHAAKHCAAYSQRRKNMSIKTCAIVGSICALVATILLYIFVFPKSREGCLNRFFKTVKKLLGSGYLLIEKVAKFIYVLQTMGCIFYGFWLAVCG